jgi:hypothetical protein
MQGESGAALILAIAFLVMMTGIGAAVLASVNSGMNNRIVLDRGRNREYAADGAVESAITTVRSRMTNGQGVQPCPTPPSAPETLPAQTLETPPVTIAVDCSYVPTLASGHYQRNVVFSAHCATVQQPNCPSTSAVIIRAQVNFASASLLSDSTINVTRTYVQSWSVNG